MKSKKVYTRREKSKKNIMENLLPGKTVERIGSGDVMKAEKNMKQ